MSEYRIVHEIISEEEYISFLQFCQNSEYDLRLIDGKVCADELIFFCYGENVTNIGSIYRVNSSKVYHVECEERIFDLFKGDCRSKREKDNNILHFPKIEEQLNLPPTTKNRHLVVGGTGHGRKRVYCSPRIVDNGDGCRRSMMYVSVSGNNLDRFRQFCIDRGTDPAIHILRNSPDETYDILCAKDVYEEFMIANVSAQH